MALREHAVALELPDCTYFGPALPEPFVKFELKAHLEKWELWPHTGGPAGRELRESWQDYRRKLRDLGTQGGAVRVLNHVVAPLAPLLGYGPPGRQAEVETREGSEDGGWLLRVEGGGQALRAWTWEVGTDLDAPNRRGRAYRFSPNRVAQRVLLARGERLGLLTDGEELRLLVCDPARPDSHVAVSLGRSGGWRGANDIPDSFLVLLALARPGALARIAEITDAARLAQTRVTAKLREQARSAVSGFVQELLDQPANRERLAAHRDQQALARELWREGLVLIYRLLFVLKLEASSDPARAFSFASTSLWRNSYSPNLALACHARAVLDQNAGTGRLLEDGLRTLFRLFSQGLATNQLNIRPLGGMLFGEDGTRLLDSLDWGERAVAKLLDRLLWTPASGKLERQRVHYGPLDVEDLGRVYEALLELEPGIATEPMCRLKRQKLEVVVPLAQGDAYRSQAPAPAEDDDDADEEEADEQPTGGKKTKVAWIEEIPAGRFYLRVGLGRKSTGSYYTPHPFVRFLVQETLGPQVEERSPRDDPRPGEILKLKVLDPAMGSGHFLVEACRFLGDKLYEACRLCDELASTQEEGDPERAAELRARIERLPDPNDELVAYLPSRVPEGAESGVSQRKAEAIARRLVAVHCLYGVDKNPLAVELAKLSLWLESYAEGLPLTFLDHRLVCGDSLTGPFFHHLLTLPGSGKPIDDLFAQGLTRQLTATLQEALAHVRELEKGVGKDVAEVESKRAAKARLDAALAPFELLARAWSGGVMLGEGCDDAAYQALVGTISRHDECEATLRKYPRLEAMVAAASGAIAYELTFPEAFYGDGDLRLRDGSGFSAVVGNPPWDTIRPLVTEFLAAFDIEVLNAPSKVEREAFESRLLAIPRVAEAHNEYMATIDATQAVLRRSYSAQLVTVDGKRTGGDLDLAKGFAERCHSLARRGGFLGLLLPAAFHVAAGATGIRRLYLEDSRLVTVLSFHNAFRLFEIETKVKFDLVVCRRVPAVGSFGALFRIKGFEGLSMPLLQLELEFIHELGGAYLCIPEIDSREALSIAETSLRAPARLGQFFGRFGMRFGSELHPTNDAHRLVPTPMVTSGDPREPATLVALMGTGYLVVANEDSIHAYDDSWPSIPRYLLPIHRAQDRGALLDDARFFRVFYRRIANIVDLRSMKAAMVPPGWVSTSPFALRGVREVRLADQLVALAMLNSWALDWNLRLRLTATLNQFLVAALPVPQLSPGATRTLAHAALRLTCNHAGYARLWQDQVGEAWREPCRVPFRWPVLKEAEDRHAVRASVDAIVAQNYALSREQYGHVLSSFSHKSHPTAPELCLAAFDELQDLGVDAFCRKHDPYWDIPLNEKLPQPAIELPIPGAAGASANSPAQTALFSDTAPNPKSKRKPRGSRAG